MKNFYTKFIAGSLVLLIITSTASATAVSRFASGANAAAIQSSVDLFRTDLGGANNGVSNSFTNGRREINWDGVPDAFSAPNALPNNFFNSNSPRGVVFSSTAIAGVISGQQPFMVSSTIASGTPINFGNLDASYTAIFQTFSAQRLFTANNSNIVDVEFFIPGTKIPATVSGFGAVFADVDLINTTAIQYFDVDGRSLGIFAATVNNTGLSFVGVSFTTERVARVRIFNGNTQAKAGTVDGVAGADVVVMDDFIYGEPRARESHSSDFDGDGTSDFAVFRPSTGQWFSLNSGSNTVNVVQFGLSGDVPVDGDFDGDSRIDTAVFRPSTGLWFVLRSSDGQIQITPWGSNGDKAVVADYDKDGKADIAVWRPSDGNYYFLRSSSGNNTSTITHWGNNGDIPVQGGAQ